MKLELNPQKIEGLYHRSQESLQKASQIIHHMRYSCSGGLKQNQANHSVKARHEFLNSHYLPLGE